MERQARFDMGGYAGFDQRPFAAHTLNSWAGPGWRALLVQRFTHPDAAGHLVLPASTDHHLWVLTAGAGRMHVDTGDGWRETVIAPGTVGRARPGVATRVRWAATAPMSSVHVHLPAGLVGRVAAELDAPAVTSVDPALLGTLLPSLAAAADRGADPFYADSAAEFLAAHLVTAAGRVPRVATDARVRRAVALMRERLDRPPAVAELAAAAGLSPYHFLRVFTRATGLTPHRYLMRLRIGEARRLLDRGVSVAETADRCGFSSPAHLSAAFLREVGVRPSRYRSA
ncbi:AraC family transcriptional regulator [Catenuloplanes nepalensis]|uniref:AraC family transcriptional regulator n=1 Tax=Catenuloplanes nepalensis TaxID=587533 RepID=A0ABT9MTB2_9ACTN|nr:AraC family transcriptional regulator [Catenuloplanes nepalensis]MDP9794681.1 AraC family transcriptional regulator [Catenuloplanes nepalensis]